MLGSPREFGIGINMVPIALLVLLWPAFKRGGQQSLDP